VRTLRWYGTGLLAGVLGLACSACGTGSAGPVQVRLAAGPPAAVFDTPVHISARGLPPGLVTVRAQARDGQGRQWQSAARFRVGPAGTLNLARAVPVSGSYHVADAAGLLWSLRPTFTDNPATLFVMSQAGFTVRLQVLAGGHVQATATLARRWSLPTRPTVQTVRRDGFASTLFTPVVASSPSSDINGAYGGKPGPAWTFHGQPLPTGTLIPVGRIRVPVLLGDGGQDAVWDSVGSASAIVAELKAAHDRAPYLNLAYPGAGHGFLGYPPYFPYSWYGPNGPLGGTAQANSLAAEQSWARMISFLNQPWRQPT
jgi:hypothetical protein